MKKMGALLFLAQVLLAPVFAFAQLTAEERAFERKCYDNVLPEKKQLSAATAHECVKKINDENGAFLARLREDSPGMGEAAVHILSYNNALVDLDNIITKNSGDTIGKHLNRVLEGIRCSLCKMGLGPEPEKLFEWVGKEEPQRLPEVKRSVRTWESLGPIRTDSLSSAEYNYGQERWNAETIVTRYISLAEWAVKETDKLAAIYGDKSYLADPANKKPDPRLIAVLREELISARARKQLAKLDKLEVDLSGNGDGKEASAPPAADKKAEELAAASKNASGLSGKSESEQAAYLSETFDRAVSYTGGVPASGTGSVAAKPEAFVYKELSSKQAAGLSGRLVTADAEGNLTGLLADELSGTKAGDEILAFFKDPRYAKGGANRLNLVFTKLPKNYFAQWRNAFKTHQVNSEVVNDWMKNNQVSPEQLFEGEPSKNLNLRKLAQYLAPTFVHEATHQRQDARSAEAGYNYHIGGNGLTEPYQMEMETEASSMDSIFMAEHLRKRGASYAGNLDPADKKNAELLLEKGVDGFRLILHRTYNSVESLEGSAAKEFFAVTDKAYKLRVLETRYRAEPGTMTEEELEQLRELRADMDSRFKWYTSVHAESAAVEAKINGWREEINSRLYPSKPAGVKPPPELL
jgi:hypothetical protein